MFVSIDCPCLASLVCLGPKFSGKFRSIALGVCNYLGFKSVFLLPRLQFMFYCVFFRFSVLVVRKFLSDRVLSSENICVMLAVFPVIVISSADSVFS